MPTTTIVALATPSGLSALAILRISGPAVADICKAVLPGFKMQPRVASLTKAVKKGETIDNLLAIYFPAPNSHTGEDVLELFPHGNPFIIRKLMEAICCVPGVQPAERGEFTERAFLNGKIDLTQAEALGDILSARDSKNLNNAHKLLSGEISGEIKALAESIKHISATLELDVDFAEDIGGVEGRELRVESGEWRVEGGEWRVESGEWRVESGEWRVESGGWRVEGILKQLQNLKKRFRVVQNELPRAVLFGAPNAGKSSLINALVNENRLLVSETPGTTRDFVEVLLHLPNGDILLTDTAGISDNTKSEIDTQAMQKTKEILEKANLKILVVDSSVPLPSEFTEWKKIADITVATHTDLEAVVSGEWLVASGPKNLGIDELRKILNDTFFPNNEHEKTWITSERQIACIKKAEECVQRAAEAGATELAAFEMREARNALFSVIGEISDESVLNAIFSSYCIGK